MAVESAVSTLKQRQAEIATQIKSLEKESAAIAKALAALDSGKPVARPAAPAAAPKRAHRKMSKLGKLKIHLGSLNRYGKKEEAKKVQEQIDALLKAGAKA
jgi:cell fate (sporulation/competence/biofilm development) regulator YmcA (YheA/YmcA/DUF963 family)